MTASLTARVVKFVNILIVAALVAAALALYWFGWRPVAKTSGRIDVPVTADATVVFDGLGEPHIRAANLDDALFAQGYCTAQERMFQMHLLRRFNARELDEVFGPQALEIDRESRPLRLRRIAEASYLKFAPADRAAF